MNQLQPVQEVGKKQDCVSMCDRVVCEYVEYVLYFNKIAEIETCYTQYKPNNVLLIKFLYYETAKFH